MARVPVGRCFVNIKMYDPRTQRRTRHYGHPLWIQRSQSGDNVSNSIAHIFIRRCMTATCEWEIGERLGRPPSEFHCTILVYTELDKNEANNRVLWAVEQGIWLCWFLRTKLFSSTKNTYFLYSCPLLWTVVLMRFCCFFQRFFLAFPTVFVMNNIPCTQKCLDFHEIICLST